MNSIRLALMAAFVFGIGAGHVAAQSAPAAVPATPTNVEAFLGEWTVSANGNYGPATFDVTLKVVDGKVVGEVASSAMGKSAVTDLSKAGPSLVLRYAFDYQGTAVGAVITLTPGNDKVDAYLDFADGAAQMAGTATKKTAGASSAAPDIRPAR
ncbi:MAG: hypothetical protein IT184_12600 [Acidobacteria bacterium]|nr:hypothetical protein [Acidobacteriota bacterium]